ncbi:hypothetical protein GOP47_0022477 [Adiantum capillus-veneris]|uniref:Thioredoxin domain-containing protein n=1 Tax=Adiantum capillus-veneris TaxID=13818 RepID=A0A9D4U6K6_ADICA|nr:hypothetical protein GOP47_0022477 [Adiantum capillus-veneris]
MFICNHCPYVVHLKKAFSDFAKEYYLKGLAIAAISSNSVKSHPQDGPEYMAADAKKYEYPFPYLYDQSQSVAKAYGAVCTPDLFLFKKEADGFVLVYHGQFDDSRPRNGKPITGQDMKAAVDCVLEGREITFPQKPCSYPLKKVYLEWIPELSRWTLIIQDESCVAVLFSWKEVY